METVTCEKLNPDKSEEFTKGFLNFVKHRTKFKWSVNHSSTNLLVKNNYLTIYKETDTDTSDLAKGNEGFKSGIHIFEINSPPKKRGKVCIVGFSTRDGDLVTEGEQALCGSNKYSFGWDLNRNKAVWNCNQEKSYPKNISDDFKAPDLFYMILDMTKGCLNFRSHSEEYGSCCICLRRIFPNVFLYPSVNISSGGSEVSIAQIYSSNSPTNDIGDISKYTSLWKELTLKMKEKSLKSTSHICNNLQKFQNIPNVANSLTISMYTLLLIDHDETESLMNYLNYLLLRSKATNLSESINIVLSLLLQYTFRSRSFSTAIVNKGCLDSIVHILRDMKNGNEFTNLKRYRWKIFGLLLNISTVSTIHDKMIRKDLKILLEEVFEKEETKSCLVLNLICLINTLNEEEKIKFNLKDSILQMVLKLTVSSSKYVRFHLSKYDESSKSDEENSNKCFIKIYPRMAFNLLSGTLISPTNSLTLLKGNLIESLITIFQQVDKVQEKHHHIELALDCLNRCLQSVLEALKTNKKLITSEISCNIKNKELHLFLKNYSSDNKSSIVNLAKICQARIREIDQGEQIKKNKCGLESIATTFIEDFLKVDVKTYINSRFNQCFCQNCHLARGDDDYRSLGTPKRLFPVPIGWFKFGLKLPARHADKTIDALNKWQRAYHGTSYKNIVPILQQGDFLKPGDTTLDGKKIKQPEGHFTEDRKPDGFNVNQTFVSPAIRYAELYSDEVSWNNKTVKTAFQVLIKPDVYTVGPETMGQGVSPVDPRISNDELEWMTYHCGAIFLYGLLIKIT